MKTLTFLLKSVERSVAVGSELWEGKNGGGACENGTILSGILKKVE